MKLMTCTACALLLAAPALAQSPVYVAIDPPASLTMPAVGGYFAGWAVNCATQQQPTALYVFDSYLVDRHDGYGPQPHMDPVPIVMVWRAYRPDVSAAIGTNCGGYPVAGVSTALGWYAWPLNALPVGLGHTFIAVAYDGDYGYNAGLPDAPHAVSAMHQIEVTAPILP